MTGGFGVSYEEGSGWKDLNIVMVFFAFKNADQVCWRPIRTLLGWPVGN